MTSAFDPLIDRPPARYVVGIDLGTTNSAVAYVDTQESPWQVRVLLIPQLVAPGVVEARDTLPSFHYEAAAGEAAGRCAALPWDQDRPDDGRGGLCPRPRRAQSGSADHLGQVLAVPFGRRSHGRPAAVARRGGRGTAVADRGQRPHPAHVRAAWDAQFPAAPLADQDFVLTLPASFDEIARELTVEAAARAGLPRVVLLEEPQAAFYAWVYKHAHDWHALVQPGQTILVCDIGGGTSDFTLIRVGQPRGRRTSASAASRPAREERIQFHRVAVGNHLILGGDNLDLALARHLEQKLTGGGKLPAAQWDVLVRICQRVKEELLGDQAAGALDGQSARPGIATDRRRAAGGSHARRSPRAAGRGLPAARDAAVTNRVTPIGFPGVRAALCGGPGDHALPGRVPDRPSPGGRAKTTRTATRRPASVPISCCSTAGSSRRRCCGNG